ncbi:DNA polymerase [bacterium]|nr:DNA polymerase [bacterium]
MAQMFSEEMLGNPHAKIWIVGSQPKKNETAPMTSQNNTWFMTFVNANEVPRSDIRFDYLVNDVAKKGGLEIFQASGQLKRSVSELKDRIAKYKPNVVLCLGAEVLQHLMGQRGIADWRGHAMQLPFCSTKAIFTYDPVTAHSQRFVSNQSYPGQYQTLMKFDISSAVKHSKFPELGHYEMNLTICTEYGKTVAILQDMLENSKILSFDIEVIKPYTGRLMDCMSIADERNINLCLPFWRSTSGNPEGGGGGLERVFKNDHEFIHILSLVKKLLESNIPKVAQNSQYDITTLEVHYDMKIPNIIWDTMIAANGLFCELPKDLGTLLSLYTNLPYHKHMIHSGSIFDRWKYSAADAGANLHVMAGQRKEMADLDGLCGPCEGSFEDCLFCKKPESSEIYKHYVGTTNPLIRNCVDIHEEGVRIDPNLRAYSTDLEHEYQRELLQALHSVIPVKLSPKKDIYNLNPKSPQQLNKLFYDLFGCKAARRNGKRSMDDESRKRIMDRDKRPSVVTLCKAVDSYIYSDASLLKFKVPPEVRANGNQYLRTKYEPAGTDTGRLASKASDVVGAGSNLQNVEKGPQREMFIPEDGEEFMHIDLYAAEAFLNFLDAGELDGLRMISGLLPEQEGKYPYGMVEGCRVMTTDVSDGLKIHNWLGDEIRKYYAEEAEKAGLKYKHAKQMIHAMNYNVQPSMMSKESGLPLSICQWVFKMYHTKFPGIQGRMKRIQNKLKLDQSLSTALLRRRYFFAEINDKLYNVAYAWPNQSTIGEVTNRAMNNLREWGDGNHGAICLPVMNNHDGLLCRVKKGTREECIKKALRAFNQKLVLNGTTIRIPVSIGFGPNFNDNLGEKVYFYNVEV